MTVMSAVLNVKTPFYRLRWGGIVAALLAGLWLCPPALAAEETATYSAAFE